MKTKVLKEVVILFSETQTGGLQAKVVTDWRSCPCIPVSRSPRYEEKSGALLADHALSDLMSKPAPRCEPWQLPQKLG